MKTIGSVTSCPHATRSCSDWAVAGLAVGLFNMHLAAQHHCSLLHWTTQARRRSSAETGDWWWVAPCSWFLFSLLSNIHVPTSLMYYCISSSPTSEPSSQSSQKARTTNLRLIGTICLHVSTNTRGQKLQQYTGKGEYYWLKRSWAVFLFRKLPMNVSQDGQTLMGPPHLQIRADYHYHSHG